ncbi:rCG57061 [Rattus norvegicus]|uniref:RCG57061 n=1 Tax=Rattus norvegicus TaxID=10116 RepID=A6JD27_RAT|nr:rCG57061 [Rattus norvegicus]
MDTDKAKFDSGCEADRTRRGPPMTLSGVQLDSGKIPRIHGCFLTRNANPTMLGHSPEKFVSSINSDHCANTRPMPLRSLQYLFTPTI